MSILQAHSLSKSYGGGETRVEALRATDLAVASGEFLAIVGPSGSGKSTLLHLLAGLDRPTTGTVWIDGQDLYALNDTQRSILRRRRIGFIFQFYNLVPVLSAEENVALPLLLDGRAAEAGYMEDLLGWLGLQERRRHLPGALSGGQQQRVAIARALVNRPAVILADEPTGNLDQASARQVLELLQGSVRRYGQALVMVTHDQKAASYADRIVTIEDGRIVRELVREEMRDSVPVSSPAVVQEGARL